MTATFMTIWPFVVITCDDPECFFPVTRVWTASAAHRIVSSHNRRFH